MFELTCKKIDRNDLSLKLANDQAGALVTFEGWVRNHNQGYKVTSLEYQIYDILALKEGQRIIEEAKEKFNIHNAYAIHRYGHLSIGDIAVWIGAVATHRDDAFKATRFIIDEIKHRLPVWKKEHYENQKPTWVFCKDHHHHVHFEENDYYKKQFSLINQEKIGKKKVLVIGAGGLGVPALLGLTAAGVGSIHIVDFDKIEISNIHRQVIFHPGIVGESKAKVTQDYLSQLNPYIKISASTDYVDSSNIQNLIQGYDLVLDCTDNLKTKYLIHDACLLQNIPLISASVFKFEGQIKTLIPKSKKGCFRCLQKEIPSDQDLGNCNDYGVLGATVNTIGSLQASEAIKLLNEGINNSFEQTIFLNLKSFEQIKIKNHLNTECSYCAGEFQINKEAIEISKEELEKDHFELFDIRDKTDDQIFESITQTKKIVLYCHRGIRSRKIVETMHEKGHTNYLSLKGGACSL